jgi:hypothetical protein
MVWGEGTNIVLIFTGLIRVFNEVFVIFHIEIIRDETDAVSKSRLQALSRYHRRRNKKRVGLSPRLVEESVQGPSTCSVLALCL